jgi:tetratricopeptide (TPR) repeat protein
MNSEMMFNMANVLLAQGRFDDARQLFLQYLDESVNDPPNIKKVAALQDVGICYKKQGCLDDALIYYQKALDLARVLNLREQIADNISNMGVIYKNQALPLGQAGDQQGFKEKLKLAERCYLEAKEIDRQANNTHGLANDLNNLGIVYRHMQDRSKAIGAYQECIKVAEKTGDRVLVGKAEMNIGVIYNDIQKWDDAISYLKKALTSMSRGGTDQAYSIAVVVYNLGIAYFGKGDTRAAKKYFQEADGMLVKMQIHDEYLTSTIRQYLAKC